MPPGNAAHVACEQPLWSADRVRPATDLELLAIQAERALDPASRLAGEYGITIACTPGAHVLWIGTEVSDAAAAELAAAFAATAPARDPAEPPPALDHRTSCW